MAWTAPMTAIAGSVFTAAQFNAHIRDNLAETAPAKATTPGSYFTTSATSQITERVGVTATQLVSDTTTSTSFTNLDGGTLGPAVTVTTSNCALVILSASVNNSSASSTRASYAVSGSSSIAAADNKGISFFGTASAGVNAAIVILETGLTAGSNTFTAQYRVAGGTGTFQSRRLSVLPY